MGPHMASVRCVYRPGFRRTTPVGNEEQQRLNEKAAMLRREEIALQGCQAGELEHYSSRSARDYDELKVAITRASMSWDGLSMAGANERRFRYRSGEG